MREPCSPPRCGADTLTSDTPACAVIQLITAGKSVPAATIAARSITTPPDEWGRDNLVRSALISGSSMLYTVDAPPKRACGATRTGIRGRHPADAGHHSGDFANGWPGEPETRSVGRRRSCPWSRLSEPTAVPVRRPGARRREPGLCAAGQRAPASCGPRRQYCSHPCRPADQRRSLRTTPSAAGRSVPLTSTHTPAPARWQSCFRAQHLPIAMATRA